jgi:transposase
MAKRRAREPGMIPVTATATCTAYRGVVESTGRLLNATALVQRVGWMSGLVQGMTRRLLERHWTPAALAGLAGGVGPDGRVLPASGWMALRRLGYTAVAPEGPEGVVVSDRVRRMAQEHAARLLRLAVHRDRLLRAVVATWPVNPARRTPDEWAAVWAAVGQGVTKAEVRNRTRQAATFFAAHGRLPAAIVEAEPVPSVSGQVLLAAADRQQVTLARDVDDPARMVLRVLLPATEHPVSYRDWAWVALDAAIPATVPVDAVLATPTLRIVDGRVRVDLPFVRPAPVAQAIGHRRALGLDWGLNTLLTGVVGRLGEDRRGRVRVLSTGHPLTFDATGVSAKLDRLRTHRERVRVRLDHYERLLAGRHDEALAAKRSVLAVEAGRIDARFRGLNKSLAWAAARWAVDHALANRCTVIYIEDLATLEARGLGRSLNRRLGAHVRGLVFDALRHLVAMEGIAVVTVPARGTSAGCPRCGRHAPHAVAASSQPLRLGLKHVKAPDRPHRTGHKWTICDCGLSCDRDHAAAERILARGLLGQPHTHRDRSTGRIRTATAIDGPVRRLPKTRRSRTAAATTTTPLAPVQREAPAPAPTPGAGQRPAGRPPQAHSSIVGQVPAATTTTRTRAGRTRDRRLSRGFHRHVTATPPHRRPAARHSLS